MNDRFIALRRAMFDVEPVDRLAVTSDRMMASEVPQRASLLPKEVSRTKFSKLHEMKKRTGQAASPTLRTGRRGFHQRKFGNL